MREDVACADSGVRFLDDREDEPIHYTATTLVTAFGQTQTVFGWALHFGVGIASLLRRLNALSGLPVELVLEMPKAVRVRPGSLPGAPGSWTWGALPWEADRWAQAWVDAHPGGGTCEEVGDALGVTRARVQQIEELATRKLQREVARLGVSIPEMLEALRELRDKRAPVAL